MPVYPADNTDTVLYNGADLYAAKDCSVTVFEDSRMFLFGEWYLNGQPLMAGPSAPSGIEVYVGPTQPTDPQILLWWDINYGTYGGLKVRVGGTFKLVSDPQPFIDADEVWVGTTAPVGLNYQVWIDTATSSVKGFIGGAWTALSVGPQGPIGPQGPKGDPGGTLTDGDKGDITLSSNATVWTIDNNVVTNAKLAQVPANTVRGNDTGVTAVVKDLTVAQTKTLLQLDQVNNTADANKPVFTTSVRGLVPAPVAVSQKYLRDDGSWQTIAAGAPIRRIIYDESGTAFSVDTVWENYCIAFSSASAVTVTLPQFSTSNIQIGAEFEFIQKGTGPVSFVAGAGATVRTTASLRMLGQYSWAAAKKVALNEWEIYGDLAAEDWILATYQNGWTTFGFGWGAAGFAKVGNLVKMRGLMAPGTKRVAAFTLPVGYRPGNKEMYTVIVAEGTPPIMGELIVQADGQVILQNPNDTTVGFVSLSNVSFIPV